MIPQRTAPPQVSELRIVLHDIRWETYEALLHDLRASSSVRLAYDRGDLELMAPLFNHEDWKSRLRITVFLFCDALGIEMRPAGSTTFRREDLQRGIEPDDCFYLGNVGAIQGLRTLDLTRDPPPDLALEVDNTSSSLDRLGIYAALRVPEVWRFDGESLAIYVLRPNGAYEGSERSSSLPQLPLPELMPMLQETFDLTETAFARAFRTWLRGRPTSGSENAGGA